MASFLKAKIGVSLFSIFIIVVIPLLESNFIATATIKRWSKLSWTDFQGIPRLFTQYGAAISSDIYLEYDSLNSQFVAYAGQNNMRSWTKMDSLDIYGLNHEQYHFNITELHARLLNDDIKKNPGKSAEYYQSRLRLTHIDLSYMQEEYDRETNHSLIRDIQRAWEYKIDSLLSLHSPDSGWITDYYAGAKVYFPEQPIFTSGKGNDYVVRSFALAKYDMAFALSSYQYKTLDIITLKNSILQRYTDLALSVKSFTMDNSEYPFKALVVAKDSLDDISHTLWLYDHSYLFKLTAKYHSNGKDSLGYQHVVNSFINSFRLDNTNRYWIAKHENLKKPLLGLLSKEPMKDNEDTGCIVNGASDQCSFFRGPMYADDGTLLIACDFIDEMDSLIFKNALTIGKEIYTYDRSSSDQLFFIPATTLPREIYNIKFGSMMRRDSTEKCYKYFYQSLEVNPYKNIPVTFNTTQ